MPFVTMVRDGVTPSSIPADNTFHHSFVVANYAADGGCLDNVRPRPRPLLAQVPPPAPLPSDASPPPPTLLAG
jgi:hypothetical protein